MFFSKIGTYKPCGVFSTGHFVLFFAAVCLIALALFLSRKKTEHEVTKTIRRLVILMWALEIAKIAYKIYFGDLLFLESWVPVYFCSLFLYAGLLSASFKGNIKRCGDIVLVVSGLIGGIIYLIYPSTSLFDYPAFHFVSFHGFLYHGAFVYSALLILITKSLKLTKKDFVPYFIFVAALSAVALFINLIFDTNLMFISKAFPGRLGKALYNAAGVFYTPLMIFVQLVLPYWAVYKITKKIKKSND